ncbi:MAG: PAS domain-containing sensor histidine kinase [Allosphingosinicella sp.]
MNLIGAPFGTVSCLGLRAFYDAIFGHPDLAVYTIRVDEDGDYRFEDANAGVVQLANRPVPEIRGSPPRDCLSEQIAECLETNLRRCIESRETLSYARTIELADGRLSWKTTLIPVVDDPAPITHVVGVTRDISYESSLEGVAETHEALLKGLDSTMPNVVYLFDLKARRQCFVTGELSRPFGYAARDLEAMGGRIVSTLVHPDDLPRTEAHLRELATLRDGEAREIEYRLRDAEGRYRRVLSRDTAFRRDASGAVELIFGVVRDMTEQDRMEEEVRDLSDRLLRLQLEERRLIAQDLHDSTAQHLIGADLAIARIRKLCTEAGEAGCTLPVLAAALEDAQCSLDEAKREIRVQTFLLHPPLLESRGLGQALAAFAAGFGARAKLKIETRIDPAAGQVCDDLALPLFRVCQEALANVHRHAHASVVTIALTRQEDDLVLSIADDGIGIGIENLEADSTLKWGVGLAGMRERMHRLGGSLVLQRGDPGTRLIAAVPAPRTVGGRGAG